MGQIENTVIISCPFFFPTPRVWFSTKDALLISGLPTAATALPRRVFCSAFLPDEKHDEMLSRYLQEEKPCSPALPALAREAVGSHTAVAICYSQHGAENLREKSGMAFNAGDGAR